MRATHSLAQVRWRKSWTKVQHSCDVLIVEAEKIANSKVAEAGFVEIKRFSLVLATSALWKSANSAILLSVDRKL
jgi:hypothetical protein